MWNVSKTAVESCVRFGGAGGMSPREVDQRAREGANEDVDVGTDTA